MIVGSIAKAVVRLTVAMAAISAAVTSLYDLWLNSLSNEGEKLLLGRGPCAAWGARDVVPHGPHCGSSCSNELIN